MDQSLGQIVWGYVRRSLVYVPAGIALVYALALVCDTIIMWFNYKLDFWAGAWGAGMCLEFTVMTPAIAFYAVRAAKGRRTPALVWILMGANMLLYVIALILSAASVFIMSRLENG